MTNTLYYGDNLPILRSMPSESVDLIYLDPPFNSSRSYNVLFKDESGISSDAQITAFQDTLHCTPTASHYLKIILDTVFGFQNFRSEITWKRYSAHNDAKKTYANITDI